MPLAHILMPQLARRAEEIAAAVGRPTVPPAGASYIQAGQRKNVEAPVAAAPRPVGTGYLAPSGNVGAPPTASDKALEQLRADEKQRTVGGTVRNRAVQAAKQADKNDKNTQFPVHPAPLAVEPQKMTNKRGQVIIPLGAGAVAMNERGESLNARGKNLGYLQSGPMRTGQQTQDDIARSLIAIDRNGRPEMGMALRTGDPNAMKLLYKTYEPHLKAMQENRNADGTPTDKFPEGYFKGMTKEQRKEIEAGVKILRDVDRPLEI